MGVREIGKSKKRRRSRGAWHRKKGRKGRLPELFGLGSRAVTRFVARLEPDGSEVDANAGRISSRLISRAPYTYIYIYIYIYNLSIRVYVYVSRILSCSRIRRSEDLFRRTNNWRRRLFLSSFQAFSDPVEDRANSVLPSNAVVLAGRNGMRIRWW